MSATLKPHPEMDAEAFLAWTLDRPGDERYELLDGHPVATAPQTFGHADAKFRIARACTAAVEAAGLSCRVILGGMGIRVSAERVFVPDVMIHSGSPIERESRILDEPLAVIEIVSRSIRFIDLGLKLAGYFSRPSLCHYLIVDAKGRGAIHHTRDATGAIATRILGAEPVRFDPPGFEFGSLFDAT